jgi:hypothetical protein
MTTGSVEFMVKEEQFSRELREARLAKIPRHQDDRNA